ncbi:MAG: GerMN domain-containing protein [Parcubacteria group bacterium]
MNKNIIYVGLGILALAILAVFLFRADDTSPATDEPAVKIENPRFITLHYYSELKDKDGSGNVMCSEEALVSVDREIPRTETPLEDTLRLFLKGELTGGEREQGISTEYPLSGLTLSSVNLSPRGVLTLDISDPERKTTGGACRVTLLRAQLEATAKQFDTVKSVRYTNPELFQP